jgi:nucleoside phosphorylase
MTNSSQHSDSYEQFPKVDVLLVTVAEVEARAVLDLFPKSKLLHIGDQTYHDLGIIGNTRVSMVQSEQGPGGQSGSILTIQEGIASLEPSAVILVGIAFGVNEKKQHIGDILVSRQIMDYDLQRIGTDDDGKLAIIPRGDRPSASPRMLSRFRAAANFWESPPKVRFGLILSGAKLVDNQDFRAQLLKFEPEAIGGEMEGGGLYAAAQRKKVDWILVKAICDWGDGHKKQDESLHQKEAAENAARFTKYVIEKGGFDRTMLQESQLVVAHNQPYQSSLAGQNRSNIKQGDTDQPSVLLQHKIETKDFDVFLCYNSGDRAAVKKIGEDLKKYGILPWLDEWELRPGLPWQRALEQQIRTIKSAAVFVGKSGMGPWHLSEMDAFLRQFKKRGCPVIPVLLPDAPQQPDLPIFLEEMGWVDYRKEDPDPLKELIWGISGKHSFPKVDTL